MPTPSCESDGRGEEAKFMHNPDISALGLAPAEATVLRQFAFDLDAFTRLRNELSTGRFPPERNRLTETIEPPKPGDITPWPTAGSALADKYELIGRQCLAQGGVAVAILNGGMATRFGGRVKGIVDVIDQLSFLALKLRNIASVGVRVPVFLMNSFATDKDTRAHLEAHNYFGVLKEDVHIVTQGISLRLAPDGALFRDASGQVSFYAPGHGDLLGALADDAAFTKFAGSGGKMIAVSNVDNLGATLEPRVLGVHHELGQSVTVEVANRDGGDTGGAPVRRGGKLEVVEGFRFPANFPTDSLPVFNTNTFVMSVKAIRNDYPLTWFRADKKVGNSPVVQFERLMGEVTAFAPSAYLEVPRQGAEGRFMPVKTPEDIVNVRPLVRARFGIKS